MIDAGVKKNGWVSWIKVLLMGIDRVMTTNKKTGALSPVLR